MKGIQIEVLLVMLCWCCYVSATLKIKKIIGPGSVEQGAVDDLVLDCDFEAKDEDDVVVKWFYNGLEEQIYQWITLTNQAFASGSLKDLIDTKYKVSNDPRIMYRALRLKDISPALSGNFTCKVGSDDTDQWLTKQVIVYAPATSFSMFLIGGDDEFKGDEVVLCDVTNVSPKPSFEIYLAGTNGTMDLPEMFHPNKTEVANAEGYYNMSITLPFNSSYLEDGTTKFVCHLSIPGTNYSETKTVEHVVDNGSCGLEASMLTPVIFMLLSLVWAT